MAAALEASSIKSGVCNCPFVCGCDHTNVIEINYAHFYKNKYHSILIMREYVNKQTSLISNVYNLYDLDRM